MKHLLELLLNCKEKGIRIQIDPSGSNLKVSGEVNRLSDLEKDAIRSYKQDIIQMLKERDKTYGQISLVALQDSYETSFSQNRIWLLSQFEDGNIAHNIFMVKNLEGNLQIDILNLAFGSLIRRHEILRTVFKATEDGELRQSIKAAEATDFNITNVDLSVDVADHSRVNQLVRDFICRPFDLANGPLLSACLLQLTERKWVFVYVMHHIISDAWSMDILIAELMMFYNVHEKGLSDPLLPLEIHFKDYASWQKKQLGTQTINKQESYWLKQFEKPLPVLELPVDKIRPAIKTNNGGTVIRKINLPLTEEIKSISKVHGGTLFTGLLTAVYVLLYKYSGQEDLIIGTPVASRNHIDLENQIGMYLNTLALRTRFDGKDSYRVLAESVTNVSMDAFKYQEYPFEALVESLDLPYDKSRNVLFDVMVTLNQHNKDLGTKQQLPDNLMVTTYNEDIVLPNSKFDLVFTFTELADTMEMRVDYNADIFNEDTILRLASRFDYLLNQLVNLPDVSIEEISLLNKAEKDQVLYKFNSTDVEYATDDSIIELFEKQVKYSPDADALVVEGERLTYYALNTAANQLAFFLRTEFNLQSGDVVAINLPRSEWIVIAILSVLKLNGVYLPVDHSYPKERIDFIIEDSQCKLVIDKNLLEKFIPRKDDCGPDNQPVIYSSADPVYVIYTSGSTGVPKGVVVYDYSLINLCRWHVEQFSVTAADNATLYAGNGFDASVWELFPYLVTGACLFMVPDGIRLDMEKLAAYYENNQISISFLPTQVGEQFMQFENSSLRHLLLGGDKLKSFTRGKYLVTNNYGPTENTVVTTSFLVNADSVNIPIGKPIANTKVYILNEKQQLCPVDLPGEIYIGGLGLAAGYLNNPLLTAEKFIKNPFHDGLIYRTGDYGRWLPDGNLEFLGRKDEQVKIRGNRVELGEIESMLLALDSVDEVVVVASDSNQFEEKELIAYLVGKEELKLNVLRSYLSARLPSYMIPAHFVQLPLMPVNANGKIDRKELSGSFIGTDVVYIAPADLFQRKLASLWEQLLEKAEISIKDDFFALGGNSLKAMRLAGMIQKEFNMKIGLREIFEYAVLDEQAQLISVNSQTTYQSILPAVIAPHFPLSSSQNRLWLLSQFADASVAYHIPGIYILSGELQLNVLRDAFYALITRHESLRTVFKEDELGNIRQFILSAEEVKFDVPVYTLSSDEPVLPVIDDLIRKPFDLSTDQLLRAGVIRVATDQWIIACVIHHIVSDGWSMEILVKELLLFYNAILNKEIYTPASLQIQYKDYAVWQQEQLKGGSLVTSRDYWLRQFAGDIPVLGLAGDYGRPPIKTYNGALVKRLIAPGIVKGLEEISASSNCTLYMTLLAVVNALLFKYTGQYDIVIGSPIAGRGQEELENQIGFYLNTLALRTRFKGDASFTDLLATVKGVTLDAYEHQDFPFDELVNLLPIKLDRSRSALFNIMMLFHEEGVKDVEIEQIFNQMNVSPFKEQTAMASKFDLTFSFAKAGNVLEMSLIYNTDIYNRDTVERMAKHFEQLAESVVERPSSALWTLDYLSAAEQFALLGEWPAVAEPAGAGVTLVHLFESQVNRTPLNTALVYEDSSLSYTALNAQANRLAYYLRERYEISPDDLVGIHLPRSEWAIIAILGILKAGGAYVPIDTEYPEERVSYMLSDSGCKAVIDEQELSLFLQAADQYESTNPAAVNTAADLAYVIYTSGSTGQPKGVMISHGSVVDYSFGMQGRTNIRDCKTFGLVSTLSADLGNTVIYTSLLLGGTLHVFSSTAVMSGEKMAGVKLDCLKIVPSHWKALQDQDILFAPQQCLIFGGEQLTEDVVSMLRTAGQRCKVYNHYGPSETTIGKLLKEIALTGATAEISLGSPIGNSYVYVLDVHDQLVGAGIMGEICIGGAGLARGYLRQPELTASRFIQDPYRTGERVYKTGDLGRQLPDGTIAFMGRKDDQVKIRGFRIELGEIERVLLDCEGITGAAVLAKADGDGEQRLVAYVCGAGSTSLAEVKAFLSRKLPVYMVPGIYVPLPQLPLTSNGKIDRKLLPDPEEFAFLNRKEYIAPRNEVESALVTIWAEVLGLEADGISVKDNFFDLGGHSLKAAQLISRINRIFLVRISIQNIFSDPTVETISEQIIFILDQNKQLQNKENLLKIEI